ncbi:MAG: spiro-SPASM protein [Spirochaetes bacterium]|nr:spiro-SPASM protein [Spirochaetota bacterium]
MKLLLVINSIPSSSTPEASPYRSKNRTALERVLEYALQIVSKESLILLGTEPLPEPLNGFRWILRPNWTLRDFLHVLRDVSAGYDTLVYVYGDCPFLDLSLTRKMLQNHDRYFADYTFADGYPYGLTPEILETRILEALERLVDNPQGPIQRDTLFTLISKDINSFDLETELSPVDLRYLRISLTTDTKRNRLLCLALDQENPTSAQDILTILQTKPEILRTVPAYLSVQITEKCPHRCTFCPYPLMGMDILQAEGFMPIESFSRVLDEGVRFCGDLVVGVSLWGEPSYYPNFPALCELVASYPETRFVVETSGIGWKEEDLNKAKDILGDRITWIVDLVTDQQEWYRSLRGEGFQESRRNMEILFSLFPQTSYVQAVRMEETEEGLEEFYRSWKARTPHIIIQKYDWFSGLLPQRKVTDLSPLHRFPCWHLKRDLTVLLDGSVPLCREDLKREHLLGNLFQQSIEEIWDRMGKVYLDHTRGAYPALCEKCDEYYTYNF